MTAMLLDLVRSMHEIVEDAKSVPLTVDKCIVDREKLLYLINETIRCLPDELENARDIVASRDQVIADAKTQAESIVANANKKVSFMVNEQEVVLAAEAQAREILLNAKTKSAEIKKLSTDYCNDSLLRTEEGLAAILEDVKNTRKKFNVK
ncbi:MAG: hypothetical protein R3Y09_05315 [Clostridia bacterium]